MERRACRGVIATINKFGSGSFTSTNDPLRSNLVRESIQVKGKEVIQKTEDESGGLALEEVVREAKCIGQILNLETPSEKVWKEKNKVNNQVKKLQMCVKQKEVGRGW